MSFTTDPAIRQAFITGLRDLADFLARHIAVPVPRYGCVIYLCADSTDDHGCVQVDRFARHLGATTHDRIACSGHYEATRAFGPITYQMTAISQARMARHAAEDSYYGCVTPDTWT